APRWPRRGTTRRSSCGTAGRSRPGWASMTTPSGGWPSRRTGGRARGGGARACAAGAWGTAARGGGRGRGARGRTRAVRPPAGGAEVACAREGALVAGSDDEGQVTLLSASEGTHVYTLRGHAQAVHRVAFSPDGRRLVTGGADEAVKLWDVATGLEVLTLRGH